MIDMDPKARRFLLRPLQRRTHGQLDPEFYVKAVRRLDQRALGEITLAQLNRVVYSLRDRHSGSWEDPARAKELVALAKALYATRRISRQEYVFMRFAPLKLYTKVASLTDITKPICNRLKRQSIRLKERKS